MPLTCANAQIVDLGLEHRSQHSGLLKDGSLPTLCRSRASFTVHGHAFDSKTLQIHLRLLGLRHALGQPAFLRHRALPGAAARHGDSAHVVVGHQRTVLGLMARVAAVALVTCWYSRVG